MVSIQLLCLLAENLRGKRLENKDRCACRNVTAERSLAITMLRLQQVPSKTQKQTRFAAFRLGNR